MDSPWNSPGQDTGVDSRSLLQGIFPTQGLNPGLLYYSQILYQLSHQRSPRILEWVASPFSRGSSQPRTRTGVSCIVVVFFFLTSWTTRESLHRRGEPNWQKVLKRYAALRFLPIRGFRRNNQESWIWFLAWAAEPINLRLCRVSYLSKGFHFIPFFIFIWEILR